MSYNNFGVTTDTVVKMFPMMVTTDFYNLCGGTTQANLIIQDVIDSVQSEVLSHIPKKYVRMLKHPEFELISQMTYGGETSFTFGLLPLNSEKDIFVYKVDSGFASKTICSDITNPLDMESYLLTVNTDYTIDYDEGTLTLTEALNVGDRVYVSYWVDVDSSSYKLQSMYNTIRLGAAAECGMRLFQRGDETSTQTTYYADKYTKLLDLIMSPEYIVPEIDELMWLNLPDQGNDIIAFGEVWR